jgi:flagellar basal body rod protein FlgF
VYTADDGIKITDKDGKTVDSTKPLATGMKITLPSGETVEIAVLGDIDGKGDISVSDARLALRAAVKLDTLTGVYEVAAEVGQGKISVSEARLILRAAVKLDDPKSWLK